MEGTESIKSVVYPMNPQSSPTSLQAAQIALLRMAGTMLPPDGDLLESDEGNIRNSIEELRQVIENSEISKSARTALLEVVKLSRNALDQYTIHGARGFKKAFKRMLAELMEVYVTDGKEVVEQTWWKQAMDHLKLVDGIAGRLMKYKPLLESTTTLFLGDGPG